ncbi:MAG TPA: DUF4124 domain-containing protein [Steroidobacteraceae bacterium]
MFRTIAIGTLIFGITATVAVADVYRWVDEHGSVHYSDEWVPGSQLIKSTRPRPPGAEQDAPHRPSEQRQLTAATDRASTQIVQENAAKAVQQDVAKVRDQQCKEAKERYAKSIQARRIFKTGADGQREYMPDEEADAYRVRARTDVQDACGSVPAVTNAQ